MSSIHDILQRVEEYAKVAGVTPESVCRAATSNPRLYDRLKKRAEQTDSDVERLEKHMRENPVVSAKRHNQAGSCRTARQGQRSEKINADRGAA